MKRKELHSTQPSIAIPPTQSTTNNNENDDDLFALLDALEERNCNNPQKIAKLLPSTDDENNNLFANISTDQQIFFNQISSEAKPIESEMDVIECKTITSIPGFENISSQPQILPITKQQASLMPLSVDLNNLPFPIPLQDEEISIQLILSNTKAICGSDFTGWSENVPSEFIKVPHSLAFITRNELIGSVYKVSLIDASNIPFEGSVQAQIFPNKPHYGMALLLSDFTLLFNFSPKPHAIITTRNVISIHPNIHPIDD